MHKCIKPGSSLEPQGGRPGAILGAVLVLFWCYFSTHGPNLALFVIFYKNLLFAYNVKNFTSASLERKIFTAWTPGPSTSNRGASIYLEEVEDAPPRPQRGHLDRALFDTSPALQPQGFRPPCPSFPRPLKEGVKWSFWGPLKEDQEKAAPLEALRE